MLLSLGKPSVIETKMILFIIEPSSKNSIFDFNMHIKKVCTGITFIFFVELQFTRINEVVILLEGVSIRMNEPGKLIPAYLQAASGIRCFYTYALPACDLQAKKMV